MEDLGDFIAFDAFFGGGGSSGGISSNNGNPDGKGCGDGCLVLILFIIVMCFFWYICW